MKRRQSPFLAAVAAAVLASSSLSSSSPCRFVHGSDVTVPDAYGTDVSYPMHHRNLTSPNPLGADVRQRFYEESIQRCVDHYGDKKGQRCRDNEDERIEMSLRQPKGMVNYTANGFTKIRAPEHVFNLIKEFWDANKDKARPENWPAGNTYVNHWDNPTQMVSIENEAFEGGGYALKQMIWNAARDTISAWTGQQLAECSLYGIRIYKEGAVLAPHVDRLPLVSSAIINVDQDVDEPWPLEVIGHDGLAHNVTMVPGDLVLYESHSILHGRPFPLKGRFMANVFIHFEPIGPVGDDLSTVGDLPPYVIPGSEEEDNWRRRNPDGWKVMEGQFTTGSTEVHQAAGRGDSESVARFLEKRAHLVNARDANGWMPLHEAVRYGKLETVEILLKHGADVNARTKARTPGASGGSVLHWAMKFLENDNPIIELLKERGAKNIPPGAKSEL